MAGIFGKILNMSAAASWLILAVVLLRLVLKRAPKWITVLLWGIVALRLVLPFSLESAWSLLPRDGTVGVHTMQYEAPATDLDIPAVDQTALPALSQTSAPASGGVNLLSVLSAIWLAGMAAMLLYALVSYARVHRRVAERMPYRDNIFLCDQVKTPFILGLLRPRIYLPSGMDAASMGPVIAHEKAHLARRDHWQKPLGFLILALHWFNPLCWAAYVLLCRDIELACDEKVIRRMDMDGKKQYSSALLACSAGRRPVTICPLAFGEVGVKERVKTVLRYKKPAVWSMVAAVAACALVTVCFATSPVTAENEIRLQATHSTPPTASFSLNLTEDVQGSVVAECWENGTCIRSAPVYIDRFARQLQLRLDPQDDGVYVQLGAEDGDTVLEAFSYPEWKKPIGWSFVSLDEGKKTPLSLGEERIIAAMAFDFGSGVYAYSCDALTAEPERVENAACLIVIRLSFARERGSVQGGERKLTLDDVVALSQKGDALTWADFAPYQGRDIGSGLYIMQYEINELFELQVGGDPDLRPLYVFLLVNSEAEERIDIRTGDVPAFIAAHYDDLPKDWERTPAPPEEEAAVYPAIETLIETICSSPAQSSNPADYLAEHPAEYQELLDYGSYTLEYCFTAFLKGGQTGLRGQIMQAALDDLAPQARLKLQAETGQEYFDAWKDAALSIGAQHDAEWIEAHQPAIYLLLRMLGEV